MADENFRVRKGLSIGDNVSISDTGVVTGITTLPSLTLTGDLRINGNDIISSTGATAITLIDDSVQVGQNLLVGDTITSINNATLKLAANGIGQIQLLSDVISVGDANVDATITSNGSGDLILNTDNNNTNSAKLVLQDGQTGQAQLSAGNRGGMADLAGPNTVISAGNGTGTGGSGSIVFRTAAPGTTGTTANTMADVVTISNGNISITPNGTGNVNYTFNNGGNILNNRNYVFGALRNATTTANGDIWALNQSTNASPARGLSLDNSADTTRTSMFVARNYGAAAGNRSRLVFERSRGTAASPTAVQNGDFLGEVDVTGYTSNGWINDQYTFVPGFFGFTASENWTTNTNLGTNFSLTLAPTATTITSSANLVPVITTNPQFAQLRNDIVQWHQGKTSAASFTASLSGNTLTVTAVASGTLGIGQLIQNAAQTSAPGMHITALGTGTGGTGTYTVSGAPQTIASTTWTAWTGFLRIIPTEAWMNSDVIRLRDKNGVDHMVIDANEALFSRPVRTKITTATVAQGGTYTPAASALNSIIVEITAGAGVTTIDVSNLTVAGENGVYDILVFNNTGGSINANGFQIINGAGNVVLSHGGTIANGARAIFEINAIDIYATAVFVTNAV